MEPNDSPPPVESRNLARLETMPDLDPGRGFRGEGRRSYQFFGSRYFLITTVLHLACALGVKTISTYYPNFRSTRGADQCSRIVTLC
ncbi:MAG: hypothetical protein CM15mP62_29320 [Rhodospirillaceae bacterium]|nr:MAG: hypothetical protein CM15mP62_29320 [Rhodospirillaceae bacterium]